MTEFLTGCGKLYYFFIDLGVDFAIFFAKSDTKLYMLAAAT